MQSEIILGPPGTGKTTSLLELVEQELANGTPPDRIGYISFTKRAANEAIERACKKFNLKASQLPHFRTIHSLCFRQLGLHSNEVLTGKALNDFAEYAAIPVTGRAWSDDGILTGFETGDRILFMENLARIRCISLREQYNMDNDGLSWNEVERAAKALIAYKAQYGLMDYTDMLTEFVKHDNDAGLKKLFVDEAQDLSRLQWQVVRLLERSCSRTVVAGDDDQAIFLWAGAHVAHLIDMVGKVRVLGQSYRCPPVIQALSNEIIGAVKHRRPKQWKPRPGGDGVIAYSNRFDNVDINDGEVLILARNASVIQRLEPSLKAEGIIYERNGVSSIKISQRNAIVTWEDLRKGNPVSIGDVCKMYDFISTGESGIARGFKTKINGYENPDEGVSMHDLREGWGLRANPDKIWHETLDKLPVKDMSYMLAILKRGDKLRGPRPRVRLSTIHSAKGAQADHVVVMKEMAERSFQEMRINPDDERRVWYVSVTRAKEKLTIVNSPTYRECPWL